MITEENLNKLYEGIINKDEITTKQLNSYGFNTKDLSDLLKNGTLERIKRGHYSFLAVNDLFSYGKKLISIKEYEKATTCFEKCYSIDNLHFGACFQLFLRKIQKKEYKEAFEYFDKFYYNDNEFYNSDNNLYIYLLNIITEIPQNHSQYAKFLKFEDIRVDINDKRYSDTQVQNRLRTYILNQKFYAASKLLNESIRQKGRISVQDIILKHLIEQAIEKQIEIKHNIVELIKEKDYDSVITYLDKIAERYVLSNSDNLVLQLIKDLKEISVSKSIPNKLIYSPNNLNEAIEGKNYERALILSDEYLSRENISKEDNAINILLTEINNEIDLYRPENYNTNSLVVDTELIEHEITIDKQDSSISTNTFADVIKYLMKEDLDNSFRSLKNYLVSINKEEYEFLIIDLIKISLLEADISFSKPMIALTYIARDNFQFNISEYLQNFYESLAQNKFDQARVYLDIISKSNKLGQTVNFINNLAQVLDDNEKISAHKSNAEVFNIVEQSIENIYEKSTLQSPEIQKSDLSDVKEKTKENNVVNYDDNEFINQQLEKLVEKGIILLKPMDSERRKRIHKIVEKIPDVVSFSIGSETSRQIVLRYKPYINEYVNHTTVMKEGNIAYKLKDYDLCIKKYKHLLEYGTPNEYVYAKIGLAYMKKFDKDTAISYLTVATELSKEKESELDFTDLINSLRGIVSRDAIKPRFKMTPNDFGDDIYENYGIECINDIADLILSGLSFEQSCARMNISQEQKNIVSLIFAKECYAYENYTMGDQFLKKAEKDKNKTKFINSLIEEVRKSKRFYKNRLNKKYETLILKISKKSEN